MCDTLGLHFFAGFVIALSIITSGKVLSTILNVYKGGSYWYKCSINFRGLGLYNKNCL